MKRTTLEGRVRHSQKTVYPFHRIVRAELERLARQVRKLTGVIDVYSGTAGPMVEIEKVLALIRQAKK